MPQQPMPNATQDWTPMVLNQKTKAAPKSKQGAPSGLTNKERKLNDATEAEKSELMPRNISAQLVAARVAHVPKMSQKDLANQLNIPIKTIQDIEQHKHPNNMALAQKIARHLKVKLVK